MKSKNLLRIIPALTGNSNLVFDSKGNIYIESIDSIPILNDVKYKHFKIVQDSNYDIELARFWNGLDSNVIFAHDKGESPEIVWDSYDKQYNRKYWAGINSITDNWYNEEYEASAPLYLGDELPEAFVVFRVDGAGILRDSLGNRISLTKDNFKQEIINKLKIVSLFNLNESTNQGKYLHNYVNQEGFPKTPMYLDYRPYEWSYLEGINVKNGGFSKAGILLDKEIDHDEPFFKFEERWSNSWKNYNLAYPNIINIKWLFDDTPATPETLRKYSLNRYYSFYLDRTEKINTRTVYVPPYNFKSFIEVKNNFFINPTEEENFENNSNRPNLKYYIDPFVSGYKNKLADEEGYWVWYTDDWYKIERIEEEIQIAPVYESEYPAERIIKKVNPITKELTIFVLTERFRIQSNFSINVSNINLNLLNDKSKVIRFVKYNDNYTFQVNTSINNLNSFQDASPNNLNLGLLDTSNRLDWTTADVYYIEIAGQYHVIRPSSAGNYNDVNPIFLNTDFGIESNFSELKRWINYPEYSKETLSLRYSSLSGIPSVKDSDGKPLRMKIYRAVFTDISDFDTDRKDTDYSKYEYELENNLIKTDEGKFYLLETYDIEPRLVKYEPESNRIKPDLVNKVIPASSEYLSTEEIFELRNGKLTPLWDKNPNVIKWGFHNSLDRSLQPYRLNNTIKTGQYNLGPSIMEREPNSLLRTHDWFLVDTRANKGLTTRFTEQDFDINEWKTESYDYFTWYFSRNKNMDKDLDGITDYIDNRKLWSEFNSGSNILSSSCVFRGLKYKIDKIDRITKNQDNSYSLMTASSSLFNTWKFSTLMTWTEKEQGYTDLLSYSTGLRKLNIRFLIDEKTGWVVMNLNWPLDSLELPFNKNDLNIVQTNDINSGLICGEKIYTEGIYYGNHTIDFILSNDLHKLTPYEFISLINSTFINNNNWYNIEYHIKDINGNINIYGRNGIWDNLPYVIRLEGPTFWAFNPKPFSVKLIQGPKLSPQISNYLDYPFPHNSPATLVPINWIESNEPLGREITVNIPSQWSRETYANGSVPFTRWSGAYTPILKTIKLFEPLEINDIKKEGNYKFDITLTEFGLTPERIISKVYKGSSPLRLANSPDASLYPRADEWAFDVKRIFIFSNPFDLGIYIKHKPKN